MTNNESERYPAHESLAEDKDNSLFTGGINKPVRDGIVDEYRTLIQAQQADRQIIAELTHLLETVVATEWVIEGDVNKKANIGKEIVDQLNTAIQRANDRLKEGL